LSGVKTGRRRARRRGSGGRTRRLAADDDAVRVEADVGGDGLLVVGSRSLDVDLPVIGSTTGRVVGRAAPVEAEADAEIELAFHSRRTRAPMALLVSRSRVSSIGRARWRA